MINLQNAQELLHQYVACETDMGIDTERVYDLIERTKGMLNIESDSNPLDSCMDCRMPLERCSCDDEVLS